MMSLRGWFLGLMLLGAGVAGQEPTTTVTLELNGFPNEMGGRVEGPGLAAPVPIPPRAARVSVPGLRPESFYEVRFNHDPELPDSDRGSSTFSFLTARGARGVDSVSLGGGIHWMVKEFQEGATTLSLRTYPILYNANSGQTGLYYVHGLVKPHSLPAGQGPQRWLALPGRYVVDNLSNTAAGWEDYAFSVDSEGRVTPSPLPVPEDSAASAPFFAQSDEYAEFAGSTIRPRSVPVSFRVQSTAPVQAIPTHGVTRDTSRAGELAMEMRLPIGGGGLNVWSVRSHRVEGGTLLYPTGKPAQGSQHDNDFLFYPVVRYDSQTRSFYFATTAGRQSTVTAEIAGVLDDQKTPVRIRAMARIEAR